MNELREFLCALEVWQVWIIGGVIAEVILQAVKKYLWQPADAEKAEKLIAAALVALALTIVAGPEGPGSFAAMWIGIFFSAIGYHETTDKLGAKAAWNYVVNGDVQRTSP